MNEINKNMFYQQSSAIAYLKIRLRELIEKEDDEKADSEKEENQDYINQLVDKIFKPIDEKNLTKE